MEGKVEHLSRLWTGRSKCVPNSFRWPNKFRGVQTQAPGGGGLFLSQKKKKKISYRCVTDDKIRDKG